MKKRLALLLAVLMLAASMPVMAMAAPTTGAEQVSVQAKSGWVKSNSRWMYYVNGRALKDTAKKIGTYYYGFDKNGYLCTGFFTLHGRTYYGSTRVGTKKCGAILRGYYHIGDGYYYFNPAKYGAMATGFVKFGGHKMAAGLTMKEEDIPLLQDRLEEGCSLREEDLTDVLHIDMELPPALWTLPMTEELRLLDPCGMSNPRPMFAARGIRLRSLRVMGKGQNVLRMEAVDARGSHLTLIWFCEAARFQEMVVSAAGRRAWDSLYAGYADLAVSMIYYPDINEWRGRKSLQFVVKDMKIQPVR